jgi:hypothetical protein
VELRIIAGILLLERMVALYFILSVVARQRRLLHIVDDVGTLRKVMYGLSLSMLGMQIVPIIIDVVGIIEPSLKTPTVPRPLGVAYALSNATFSIIASVMLWLIYETIDRDNIKLLKENTNLKDDKAHLQDDKKQLKKDLAKEKRKH